MKCFINFEMQFMHSKNDESSSPFSPNLTSFVSYFTIFSSTSCKKMGMKLGISNVVTSLLLASALCCRVASYETPTLTRTPDTTRTRTHEHLSNTSNSTWTRASLSCRCRCRVGHWTRLGAGVSVLHRAQAGKKKKEERILAIQ